MSAHCCSAPPSPDRGNPGGLSYRRILWIALASNAAMFVVEIIASWLSGSSALAADAADFLGDSANYALSLAAIAAGGAWLSRVALLKGAAMTVYGVGVLAYASWRAWLGTPPEPLTMGFVALLALCVNFGVAVLLFRFREGDANMRSVWLCTRNDVIANLAVLAAAAGVFGTGSVWPDVGVAVLLATLGVTSGAEVVRRARAELRDARAGLRPATLSPDHSH
ncbi:MAG TPA: cation transporter [Burkholderiales bacterium]|nr:cation transporter [Burkholderiales bacterium]